MVSIVDSSDKKFLRNSLLWPCAVLHDIRDVVTVATVLYWLRL